MPDIRSAALEEPPVDGRSSGVAALPLKTWLPLSVALVLMAGGRGFSTPVATTEALVAAVRDGAEGAVINNRLTGISDTARYENRRTKANPGLEPPLKFACGVHGEAIVDGWQAKR